LEDAYRPAEAPEQPNSWLPMMKFSMKQNRPQTKNISKSVRFFRHFAELKTIPEEGDTCKNQIRALESARERTGSVARLVMFFASFLTALAVEDEEEAPLLLRLSL
jgi:hypothetical protein